jgi:2-phospho-L-lactate guanylyltransferase
VQASIHSVSPDGGGTALLDDGTQIAFTAERLAESGLLHVRPGQRVSVELDERGSTATRVWIVGIGPGEVIR